MLKDAHVLLSGLKAHVTENSYSDIKTLRECCGGHGYLRVSGLPSLVEYLSALVTLEGDTFVMYLQAATQLVRVILLLGSSVNLRCAFSPFLQFSSTKEALLNSVGRLADADLGQVIQFA